MNLTPLTSLSHDLTPPIRQAAVTPSTEEPRDQVPEERPEERRDGRVGLPRGRSHRGPFRGDATFRARRAAETSRTTFPSGSSTSAIVAPSGRGVGRIRTRTRGGR